MSIIDQITQQYPQAQRWMGTWDRECLTIRSSRGRQITLRTEDDGVRVCAWVGSSRDMGAYLEGRSYRSARGALRMIAAHLDR